MRLQLPALQLMWIEEWINFRRFHASWMVWLPLLQTRPAQKAGQEAPRDRPPSGGGRASNLKIKV